MEKNRSRCRKLQQTLNFRTLCTDGIDFLSSGLKSPDQDIRIVAAAPVHVAYEWMRAVLPADLHVQALPVPIEVARLLPNPVPGNEGQIFASNADFICPPDCSEAGRLCSGTRRPRPRVMYAYLQRLPYPRVKKVVIRSFQLAPGVGALRPCDLFAALDDVRAAKTPILLATACKCHAVVNLFHVMTIG